MDRAGGGARSAGVEGRRGSLPDPRRAEQLHGVSDGRHARGGVPRLRGPDRQRDAGRDDRRAAAEGLAVWMTMSMLRPWSRRTAV